MVQAAHAKGNIRLGRIHVMHVLTDELHLRFPQNLGHQTPLRDIFNIEFDAGNSRSLVAFRNPEAVEAVIGECVQKGRHLPVSFPVERERFVQSGKNLRVANRLIIMRARRGEYALPERGADQIYEVFSQAGVF
jgi:hypothetical protein